MAEEFIDVLHIGPKEIKVDRESGITWYGRESQSAPRNHANRLLQFPTVFVRADEAVAHVDQEPPDKRAEDQGKPSVEVESDEEAEEVAASTETPNLSIEDAISLLEPGNAEHFGGKGAPRLDAVKALAGDDVTVAQLREVWQKVKPSA